MDKVKEQRILSDLKGDYTSSKTYNDTWHTRIDRWRDEYFGKPYGNEVEGKSRIISRDIKKVSEWLQASILDPFVSTPDIVKCSPITHNDILAARSAELVLNTQFCRQLNRFNFLSRALKCLDIEGTCIVKTGWEYAEEERELSFSEDVPVLDEMGQPIIDPETQQPAIETKRWKEKHMVPLINRPTAELCRYNDIYLDPLAMGDIDNCQFIIHRFETDLSTLKADGRYKNLERIPIGNTDPDYIRKDDYFEFNDKARKKVIVYEYWGNYDINGDDIVEPIVCAWVEDVIIRLDENPYPDKKPPFIVTPLLPMPFELYGESNAEMLSDVQKIKTAIHRGFLDNMAASNNGQIGVRVGALDETNKNLMLKGMNFQFNGSPNDFFVGSYNPIPNSSFNILQMLDAEAMSLTGVNTTFNQQTTNLIGESGASSRGVLDGGNLRKLMIVKSVSENLIKPLLRKWLEYNAELLDEETVLKMTNGQFEIIRRDDLYGNIEIDLSISTNEDNSLKARELAFLLQTIGPHEDPEVRKILMAEIARLHKMHDLAHKIETFQPQPDPMAQAMQEAQLRNIEAQTQELQASAQRAGQDAILKQAKIPVESAKAKQIGSQTDLKNLEYYQKDKGIDRINDMTKFNNQLASNEKIAKAREQAKLLSEIIKAGTTRDQQAREAKKKPKTDYSPSTQVTSNRNPYNTDVVDDTI